MGAIYQLQNDFISISVKSYGAELCSLIDKEKNRELMWQADPKFWPRHAPLLFPVVGKLKDNSFQFKGKNYILNQHGFARQSEFEVFMPVKNQLTCRLQSSQESLKVYPFSYEFETHYILQNHTLKQVFIIKNTGKETMYASVGAHPAFAINLSANPELHFTPHLNHYIYKLQDGSIKSKPWGYISGELLEIENNTFDEDALILDQTANYKIALAENGNNILTVDTGNMPYLGIWAKPAAPFVCVEPWCGMADFEEHDGDITKKKGIIGIEPGDSFEAWLSITIPA